MRATSRRSYSKTSQNTPENSGEYTLRPSKRTSNLSAEVLLKPRTLMAYWRASARATCTPGTRRSASAKLRTPLRCKSSAVITVMAAAASVSGSARLETELISMFIKSLRLSSVRSVPSPTLARAAMQLAASAKAIPIRFRGFCIGSSSRTFRWLALPMALLIWLVRTARPLTPKSASPAAVVRR